MSQQLITQYLSRGRLQEAIKKIKGNYKLLESHRGLLQEMVAYKRFQI